LEKKIWVVLKIQIISGLSQKGMSGAIPGFLYTTYKDNPGIAQLIPFWDNPEII